MSRLGFATMLGVLIGCVSVGVLGHRSELPLTLQAPYDSLMGRTKSNPPKPTKKVSVTVNQTPKSKQLELPDKVRLPQNNFLPVALIQTPSDTHLVYLAKGKPKMATSPGWVLWSAEGGLVRLILNKKIIATVDPKGSKVSVHKESSIDVLSRFDYLTGSQHDLYPSETAAFRLEDEDLEVPEVAAEYYLQEERRVLGFVKSHAILQSKKRLFMGGAHPVLEGTIEKVRLSDGKKGHPRYERKDSNRSFAALREKSKRPECSSVHKETVGLRGPLGQIIPVAVAEGELELCAGRMTLHWQNSGTKPSGPSWPQGLRWSAGQITMFGSKSSLSIRDIQPVLKMPAILVFEGKEWLPGFKDEGEQVLSWITLKKDLAHQRLGSIGPVLGLSPLNSELMGARESLRLAQVFGLRE